MFHEYHNHVLNNPSSRMFCQQKTRFLQFLPGVAEKEISELHHVKTSLTDTVYKALHRCRGTPLLYDHKEQSISVYNWLCSAHDLESFINK